MNTFFYQTEVLKQEELRRHLTAERYARVEEARLATAAETGRPNRFASALSLRWRRLRADRERPMVPVPVGNTDSR